MKKIKLIQKRREKIIKIHIFLIFLLLFYSYSSDTSKKQSEEIKRIFIVKPKEQQNEVMNEEKNNPSSLTSSPIEKKEKILEIFYENIKLININSLEIVTILEKFSTAKIIGMEKELMVKGTKEEIDEVKFLIEKFDKGKRQVEIKATIIDTSDNLFERLGIDFSAGKNSENKSGNINSSFLDGNFSLTSVLKSGGNFLGINIDLLKENGDIKIEAMPVVLILEGEEAELKVTEEVVIGEKKHLNKENEYIEPIFAEAGVLFKIKPEIKEHSQYKEILLYIDSEISNFKLSSNFNANQGAKQKNKINTVVSLKDGSSIFIGGLKQNVRKESEKKIPVLSNIPIIGSMFKYKRKNKEIRDIYIEIEGKIKDY